MTEHTPTPWAADPDDREGYEWNIHIVTEHDRNIRVAFMTSGPEAEPNAALIVKAVNMHQELVDALKACRRQMQNDWHDKPRIGMEYECGLADAAIAKAEAMS